MGTDDSSHGRKSHTALQRRSLECTTMSRRVNVSKGEGIRALDLALGVAYRVRARKVYDVVAGVSSNAVS